MTLYDKEDPAARSYLDVREYFDSNIDEDSSSKENLPECEPDPDYVAASYIEETTSEENTPRAKRPYKHLLAGLEEISPVRNWSETDEADMEPFLPSESDYIPDSEINTSDDEVPKKKKKTVFLKKIIKQSEPHSDKNTESDTEIAEMVDPIILTKYASKSHNYSDTNNLKKSDSTETEKSSENANNIHITLSRNQAGIRAWDKKHACVFCSQLVTKLPRHLESKHFNEKEVLEFLILPKKSRKRKLKIESIRQMGNYLYNSKVIDSGKGDIIPKKRSKKERNMNDMAPCKICYGLYAKKDIYLHYRKCQEQQPVTKSQQTPASNRKCFTTFPVNEGATEDLLADVISNMREDEILHVIRKDSTILKFGSNLHQKHKAHPHLKTYVAQRMRQLGRLVLEVNKINPEISNLCQIIHPSNFDLFVQAVKNASGFNPDNTYNIPSLALRLRSSVQQSADILKSESIKKLDFDRRKEIESFIELITMNFTTQIATHALNTVYTKKWNKTTILPIAKDLKKLVDFLQKKAEEVLTALKIKPTIENWSELCDVTLVQTLIFNRRRAGEVERIFLNTYLNRDKTPISEEIKSSLNDIEKHLVQTLTRFETRGKRGRKVPILLTKEMKNQVDSLCAARKEVNVPEDNMYLFSNPKTTGFKRAAQTLKKFAIMSKTENPDAITSTKLRKQVATACQLLNLKENEMDQLATYMGHDIRVHREFYRLPDSSLQVSKVSKLLLTLDKGNIIKNKGKNFDNMNIEADSSSSEDNEFVDEPPALVDLETTTKTTSALDDLDLETTTKTSPALDDLDLKTITKTSKLRNKNSKKKNKKQISEIKENIDITNDTKSKKKKSSVKKEWTAEEKDAIQRQMAIFWIRKKVPNKAECEECLRNEPTLHLRSWKHIKYYVYNIIKKNSKKK